MDKIAVGKITDSVGVAVGSHITQIVNYYLRPEDDAVATKVLADELQAYLAWVQRRYGRVTMRGMRRLVELPLDRIYAPLLATAYTQKLWGFDADGTSSELETSDGQQQIQTNELLSLGRRIVAMGGPGSGKTTVLQYIAFTLATALLNDNVLLAQSALGLTDADQAVELPIPVILPLSIYARARRANTQMKGRTLAAVIANYLVEQQQEAVNLLPSFFMRLLQSGRYVILLLDGLDEVPDEGERSQVRQSIEQMVDGKPDLRIVVTCRTRAYQGRTALGRDFQEVRVEPLDAEHLEHLVRHAYGALYNDDAALGQRQIQAVLEGIDNLEAERRRRLGKGVRPLIDSPLIVRMLLIVHQNERRFPQHRAALYHRVIDNLIWPEYGLDDADALKLLTDLNLEPEIHRDFVQQVAWELHKQGAEQGRELEEYMLRRLLRGAGQPAGLIERFIVLTRLRGALLEEQQGLYRFIHLAFQEFMVARYLAEVVRGEGGIEAIVQLVHREQLVLESWWREPILLLAGYLSMNARRNARSLISMLADANSCAACPPAQLLATIELAGSSALEWFGEDAELCALVARRLTDRIEDAEFLSQTLPSVRVTAGLALGRLGDLRPGVGVKNGLPDIVWHNIEAGPFPVGVQNQLCTLITQPFAISRYPITIAQYACFVAEGGYAEPTFWTEAGRRWRNEQKIDAPDHDFAANQAPNQPQVGISWYEAVAFCCWLAARIGGSIDLPTEIEWERAARGTDGRNFPWGEAFDNQHANMRWTGIGFTSPVGLFPAGKAACGAVDMAGNVWEWCKNSWCSELEYRQDPSAEKALNKNSEKRRLLRGGSWANQRQSVRCAKRHRDYPHHRGPNVGFRIVLRQPLA